MTPSGASAAAAASAAQSSAEAGTPATPTVPATVSTTMSSTSASSRWAASCLALSTIASVALSTAEPPSCSEREPPVPPPVRTRSVSLCTRRMRSIGMPVRDETIMANAVWWPWPCADVPAMTVAEPSAWTSTAPYSLAPPPAVIST